MKSSQKVIIGLCIVLFLGLGSFLVNQIISNRSSAGKVDHGSVHEQLGEEYDNEFSKFQEAYEQRVEEGGISILDSDNLMNELTEQYYEKNEAEMEQSYTLALFGTDERSTEISRSDIIIIIKYWPYYQSSIMVSVPRDSLVEIEGYGKDKINHAYAFGGHELLMGTLENLFDTHIDYYVKLSFEDFKNIVEEIEGVEVNAKKDYLLDDSTKVIIPKGKQVLSGEGALFYVRFRSDEEGDLGRIKRQQEVIEALTDKIILSDRSKGNEKLKEIYDSYLETDMEVKDFIAIFSEKIDKQEEMDFETYTLKTKSKRKQGIWYEIVDEEYLEHIKSILQN